MEFINVLQANAFDNLDVNNYIPDTHGWMDNNFENIIMSVFTQRDRDLPLIIIEVGSWKGKSCITIANAVKKMGFRNVKIIAIDTWLGAPEFWTWGINDSSRGKSLQLKNGYPTVYNTFIKNIKHYNHHDIVAPFPISSIQAADVLQYYKLTADLIYVDASHEYKPVKEDIFAYRQILKDDGVMIGDDYMNNWPGVIKAVNECGKPEINGVVWKLTIKDFYNP